MTRCTNPLIAVLVGCLPVATSTCNQKDSAPSTRATLEFEASEKPILFIHIDAGRKRPSARLFGTAVAVWQDGSIIRARSYNEIGLEYERGTLTSDQLKEVKKLIETTQLFLAGPGTYIVPDGGSLDMVLRTRDGVKRWAYWEGKDSQYGELNSIALHLIEMPIADAQDVSAEGFIRRNPDWYE